MESNWTDTFLEILYQWIARGKDFDQLLEEALAVMPEADRERCRSWALVDKERFQGETFDYFRRLRGDPERMRNELAGALRW